MKKNTINNQDPSIRLKILIIGDSEVGKTSMLLKYTDNYFPESHLATIGVEFKTKELKLNNYVINLQIWDTAGQERFRSITKNFFRNTNGVIFMYDITNKKSFKSVKDWIRDSEINNLDFKRILVGNKVDLKNKREVDFNEVKEWSEKKEIESLEVSAKLGINVENTFKRLVELILGNKTKTEILEKFGMDEKKNISTTKLTKANNYTNVNKKSNCCNKG